MSYDISNYVFKGVPISEFVANFSKHPNRTSVSLTSESEGAKTFLIVDDALVASLNETKKSSDYQYNGVSIEPTNIAITIAQEGNMRHEAGPTTLLVHTVLRACGVSVNDLLSSKEESDPNLNFDFMSSFSIKFDTFALVEMHGKTLPMGVIEIPDEMKGFIYIASKKENWNLINDPKMDPESYETLEPALTLDLVKNIDWAIEESTSNEYDNWREEYCAMLINMFIEPHEEFVEEDDCWTSNVGVASTRYGDVHQHGGMEDLEMYLVVSGEDMSGYDEEGWSDPEKETPTAFKKLKEILFGDPDYPTKKYTPQFGG